MASFKPKINFLPLLINFTIFTIPFGVIASFGILPGVRIYLLDIFVGLVFLNSLILVFKQKLIPQKKLCISLGLFVLFAFVSLLLNIQHLNLNSFFVSLLYLLRFIAYSSLLFAPSFLTREARDKIPVKLFISGIILTIFGFLQFVLYRDLRNLYYAGWDEHLYRLFSTVLDPNFAGAILVLTGILGLSLWFSRGGLVNDFRIIIPTILILPAILLTYSRSTFLMLSISVLSFLVFIKQIKFVLLFVVLGAFGVYLLPKNLGGEGVNLFRSASIEARLESYSRALTVFSDSPIYGSGFNAYRYTQERYGFDVKDSAENHAGAGVSNSFLFVLATTGIVGLLVYLNIWRVIVTDLFKQLKKNKTNYIVIACLISIIGLFIHTLFENSLFYIFIMTWIFLLIGSNLNKEN